VIGNDTDRGHALLIEILIPLFHELVLRHERKSRRRTFVPGGFFALGCLFSFSGRETAP
jgi:hypothetical protein